MSRYISVPVTDNVEIDMNDIDMGELIDEIERRIECKRSREDDKALKALAEKYISSKTLRGNLQDQLKNELFEEQRDKFSLTELQQLLNR